MAGAARAARGSRFFGIVIPGNWPSRPFGARWKFFNLAVSHFFEGW